MDIEIDKEAFGVAYRNLIDKYRKSNMVSYGRPDNFQFHQNELSQAIAELLLQPIVLKVFQCEEEGNERTEK
jgi:hypothetical protein